MKTAVIFISFLLLSAGLSVASEPEALLERLVNINSGTKNVSGVNRVQNIVAKELKKIGFKVKIKSNPKGKRKSGRIVVGTIRGKKSRFITFVTHADTVFSTKSKFQKFRRRANGTATGPGVIDDKGGIIVALEGIREFLKKVKRPKYSFRFVSSPSEETGSSGFLDSFRNYGKDSVAVLGFEPALEGGSIIESRRGNRWYHIEISGKEGHAGRSHKDGVNACHEISIKLNKLQNLTDYSDNVTVSIGHMTGGQDKFNIICGHAEAKVDTRFSTIEARDELHEEVEEILNEVNVRSVKGSLKTKTTYTIADDCPPFSKTSVSEPYLKAVLGSIKKFEGKSVVSEKSGGAADSNYMSREGLIVIDGLGAVGGEMHTEDEFVILSSLKTRAQVLADLLQYFESR